MASISGSKQKRKGMVMIWIAVIWTVWRHRNKIVFENGAVDLVGLLDDVKTISWRWHN
jgi:cbb3-type cytochrome oxidase subunit 3